MVEKVCKTSFFYLYVLMNCLKFSFKGYRTDQRIARLKTITEINQRREGL